MPKVSIRGTLSYMVKTGQNESPHLRCSITFHTDTARSAGQHGRQLKAFFWGILRCILRTSAPQQNPSSISALQREILPETSAAIKFQCSSVRALATARHRLQLSRDFLLLLATIVQTMAASRSNGYAAMLLLGMMLSTLLLNSQVLAVGIDGLETTADDMSPALGCMSSAEPSLGPAYHLVSRNLARLLGLQLAAMDCPAAEVEARRADRSRHHELRTLKCFTITKLDLSHNTTMKVIDVGANLAVWMNDGDDLAVEVI